MHASFCVVAGGHLQHSTSHRLHWQWYLVKSVVTVLFLLIFVSEALPYPWDGDMIARTPGDVVCPGHGYHLQSCF